MKQIFTVLSFLTLSVSLQAQELKFDKKSGDISGPGGVVAKVNSERVKSGKFSLGVGKNYYVTDAGGSNEYLAYLLHRFEDTLGGPTTWYYSIHCKSLGLTAYHAKAVMIDFKEVGAAVVTKSLVQPDGKMNEAAVKDYLTGLQQQYGDMDKRFREINDSEMQLVNIPAPLVERNMRKEVTANEFGKIGQGNVAIGTWEFIEASNGDNFNGKTYHFRIKNMNGGIIAISWIELSGAHTYIFKEGVRSDDNWTVPDFINNNPIHNKQAYVVQLAQRLIGKGLL